MAKQEQIQFSLNPDEYRLFVDVLNSARNERLAEQRPTELMDELLQKASAAPVKKVRLKGGEPMR